MRTRANAYDAVIPLALADDFAKTTDGTTVAKDMKMVANPPGTPCYTYPTCLSLLKAGKKIDCEGVSGNLDRNQHNNTFGPMARSRRTRAPELSSRCMS